MGQAKARRQLPPEDWATRVDLTRLAQALDALTRAASPAPGSDCLLYACLGQAFLAKLGIPTRVRMGHASWRVGPGDGDVIAHVPTASSVQPPGVTTGLAVPLHAWLTLGQAILDLTTGSLPMKAALLDAADGGHTTVQWAPAYLLVDFHAVRSYEQVRQGATPGLCFYKVDPAAEAHWLTDTPGFDVQDLAALTLRYDNPSVQVIGPNTLRD